MFESKNMDVCSESFEGEYRSIFYQRLSWEDPKPMVEQLLSMLGVVSEMNLFLMFEADVSNRFGLMKIDHLHNSSIILEFMAHTLKTKTIVKVGKEIQIDDSEQLYRIPMRHTTVETINLSSLLTAIGGYWTGISAVTFILVSSLLHSKVIKKQAEII